MLLHKDVIWNKINVNWNKIKLKTSILVQVVAKETFLI